jgi:5'(3')-deoxyribonucleotidase
MKRLSDNSHIHIYIVSISDKHLMKTKIDLIEREYPFIHSNDVIFIHNKQLLNLDILVDDKFDNLLNAPYKGVLFTAPWNTSFNAEYNGLIRVNDWSECYDYIMNRLNSKTKIYKLYH